MNAKLKVNQPVITALEINTLLQAKDDKRDLKQFLEEVDQTIKRLEFSLIERFERGAYVPNEFQLDIKNSSKTFPKWKEHFLSVVGVEKTEEIISATPSKIYRQLVVKKAA